MQFPFTPSLASRISSGTFRRVLLGICTLLLAMQLIGSVFHNHDPAEVLPDCVGCHLAAQPLADIPAAPAAVLAVLLVVAYLLALCPNLPVVVVLRYLIPSRQAPPRP